MFITISRHRHAHGDPDVNHPDPAFLLTQGSVWHLPQHPDQALVVLVDQADQADQVEEEGQVEPFHPSPAG